MVKIGIIGGTGVDDPNILKNVEYLRQTTPYGNPSDVITHGFLDSQEVFILPRHGSKHTINPTHVNYRANIHALKQLGVTHILAPSAVGSLKEEILPGDIVFTDQFIDRTFARKNTFYDKEQVCHISVAEPTCEALRKIAIQETRKINYTFHEKGTIVVIEGPRFSTKAESKMYQKLGADIIGMTMVPEAVLAREAEMCYLPIALVTDYDVWKESHVTLDEVLKTMKNNNDKIKKLLLAVIPNIPAERSCPCKTALSGALI